MSTRRTSIEAYNTIKENGMLSALRWETYAGTFKHGPCTAAELSYEMGLRNNLKHPQPNGNIRARLSELREMGVVYEVGIRECKITGMRVIEWDVTDRLPEKRSKKKEPKQICLICCGTGFLEDPQ